ncbi:MAG TPA: class II aldolase/adducin family protein [Caulobacteraceae bacterium]|jgi:ribulose-5-phosphate 4-epimerase/fuculose-1-phosphate aldolase
MPDDASAKPRNYDTAIPSIQHQVSPQEWAARVDLAACYRLIDLYGMSDLIANHVSVRVPGEPGHFLINPYGLLYDEMTASSMLKIDLDGNVIAQPPFDYGVNRAGFVIHAAIHRARHDVDCVIHTHTAAGMAVSSLECGLLPLNQTAMRFAHCAYHDYEGVVLDLTEQERLAADLGDHDLMILRNHGLLVVGQTIAQAFNHIHRAELSCRTQLMAMACGTPLHSAPTQVIEATFQAYQPNVRRPFGVLDWPALLRKLDRLDPSYRT